MVFRAIGVQRESIAVSHDDRPWQELLEMLGHRAGASTGAATGVRCRERLVQIEVADIESGVPGPGDTEDAIGVGLVV